MTNRMLRHDDLLQGLASNHAVAVTAGAGYKGRASEWRLVQYKGNRILHGNEENTMLHKEKNSRKQSLKDVAKKYEYK